MEVTRLVVVVPKDLRPDPVKRGTKVGHILQQKRGTKRPFLGGVYPIGEDCWWEKIRGLSWMEVASPLPPTNHHPHTPSFSCQKLRLEGSTALLWTGKRLWGDGGTSVEVPCFWWGPLETLFVELAVPAAGSKQLPWQYRPTELLHRLHHLLLTDARPLPQSKTGFAPFLELWGFVMNRIQRFYNLSTWSKFVLSSLD